MVSCSSENTVKETATSYLKKQMKNPDSFKVESIEVRKDTIPYYLTDNMLTLAKTYSDALDDFSRYSELGDLFTKEKIESSLKTSAAADALKAEYNALSDDSPSIEYVAYVKYSAKNAIGGTLSGRAIVIVDSNDPKKVLGLFDVDSDLITNYYIIRHVGSDMKFELTQNKYGKYDTSKLPYIDQFIFNEEE